MASVARLSPDSAVRFAPNAEVVFFLQGHEVFGSVLPQRFAKTEVDLVGGDRKLEVECGADAVLDECAGSRRAIAWVAFHPVQ